MIDWNDSCLDKLLVSLIRNTQGYDRITTLVGGRGKTQLRYCYSLSQVVMNLQLLDNAIPSS